MEPASSQGALDALQSPMSGMQFVSDVPDRQSGDVRQTDSAKFQEAQYPVPSEYIDCASSSSEFDTPGNSPQSCESAEAAMAQDLADRQLLQSFARLDIATQRSEFETPARGELTAWQMAPSSHSRLPRDHCLPLSFCSLHWRQVAWSWLSQPVRLFPNPKHIRGSRQTTVLKD